MANPGSLTAYDLVVGRIVNISEMIYMYMPDDLPLTAGVNADGTPVLGVMGGLAETKWEWQDDEWTYPVATMSDSGGINTTDTTIGLATGHGAKFKVGDYFTMSGPSSDGTGESGVTLLTVETCRVDAIDGDSLTVTRDVDGKFSTNPAWADGTELNITGQVLVEGATPGAAKYGDRTRRENYTRIYGPEQIDMSRTAQRVRRYGVRNEFDYQTAKLVLQMAQERETNIIYGKVQAGSASDTRRNSAGLAELITTNRTDLNGVIEVSDVEAGQQLAYDYGGMWRTLMANPKALATINDTADEGRVRQTYEDPRRGRIRVQTIDTEFGEVTVVRNRFCKLYDAFGINSEQVKRVVMDPMQMVRLAKHGDSDQVMFVAEETLEVQGEKHMIHFNGISAS